MTKTEIKKAGAALGLLVAAGSVIIPLVGVVQAQTRQSITVEDHEKRIDQMERSDKVDHDAVTRIDATVSRMEKQLDKVADRVGAKGKP